MSDLFLISDPHFGHANVIKFGNRPFDNIEHMEEVMVERWNSKVKKTEGDGYSPIPVEDIELEMRKRKIDNWEFYNKEDN